MMLKRRGHRHRSDIPKDARLRRSRDGGLRHRPASRHTPTRQIHHQGDRVIMLAVETVPKQSEIIQRESSIMLRPGADFRRS